MYLNKAYVIGNLTRDPELRSLPSGQKVCSFSVATNRVYKDANGQRQEATDYHNIVVFARQAETAAQYLKKGSSVLVEGRMQTRSWEAEGQKKYRTEIVADRVQFGNRPGGAGSTAGATGGGDDDMMSSAPSKGSSAVASAPQLDTIEYPEEEINPDDIPF